MTPRGIDHLVIAVRDLDMAAALYERLGFQVGARNRHPWGTENRLIQFERSFIELIALGEGGGIPPHRPRAFSFGAFVRDYLGRREGLALLALGSDDAQADAAFFVGSGVGDFEPFSFRRGARRPDGSETEVAFTLAFAADPRAPDAGFFVCQHHYPDNFWNRALQEHANGAEGIAAVVLSAEEPQAHRSFLERFAGAPARLPRGSDISLPLDGARLDVTTPDDAAELYGSVEADPHRAEFVAFAVRVPDMRALAHRLDAAGVPYGWFGSRLVVPASVARGVAIAFDPA